MAPRVVARELLRQSYDELPSLDAFPLGAAPLELLLSLTREVQKAVSAVL